MANNGGSSPRIMVFRPTMEEFQRFSEYIKKIEDQGAHKAGLAKIIPPENWCPRKGGYDDISMVIPSPISQVVTGRQGLYQQINIQQKSMTVKEFQKLAESNKYGTPTHFDYEDLERKYWKNITYNSPIYGADVSGSLYDDGIEEFNIQHLNTILDLVADDYGIQIDGVNTAYLYFGMWKTTFAWHTEDMDLYSINYLHFGAPKSWYAIPPEHGRRLERLAAGFFHGSFQSCPAFLRHKMTIISPQILKQYSIPYNKITQEPGEFMITFPFGYHSGFNHGFNCAESTNFAMPRWVEYGKRALSCSCRNDCVKICMDMFVRKFQPERYELWKQGKDVGPHPEDPSRQYAAQPPNKAELAIAAQRERRRVKKEQTQNLKRHPISKIGKGDAKLQIHSNKDESRFQGTEKSDSEETEIYDIEEILKKSKRKKRNSTDCPVEKTVQKPRKVSKKPVYDGRVRIKSESSFSSTSEEMEQNILDNPPDLKPFWDSEVVKPKMEIHDHSDFTVYGVSSSNKKTSFSDYPSLNKSSESLLSIAYHQQSYLPSEQLPIMQARNNDNGQIASDTLNNALENPCFSSASNFAHSYKRVVQTNNQGLTLKVKSEKFSDNESIVTEESDLSIPKWSCKQTEKGLKIKIVSPKGSSHELYPLAEHEITPCTSHSLKAEKLIHGSIDLNLTGNIQQARASASSVSVDHAYLSSANLMSLGQHIRRNKKTKKLKCDTSKESSVNWVSPVAGLLHHVPPNIEAERHFNKLCSAVKPHCAVCNIFTPLDNSNSILHEGMIIPSYSPVKMPAVCFSKGIDNLCSLDSNPLLNRDGSSPLVVCSHCYVCVHATCYGITILKLGPWLCARCASHAENASCCLCVLRGGALKPTTDGRWVHVICAALVEEVHFENTVLKEPVNVSHVVRKRINLKCVYCFKSVVPKRNYSGCCIQCRSGKCSVPFHVTCGYMAGVHFESRDWPDPVVMTCTRHVRKKHVKRQFTNVEVGDNVLVKHKNRRYYWVTVKKKYHQKYYSVLFLDNSTSTNLLPEDIIDENGVQREHPDIGEEVLVKWIDGKIYRSIFQGSRSCDVFVVEFEDGVVSDLERNQFFAADEAIPKEVLSRVCPKSEIQHSSNVHSSDQISNNPVSSSSSS